MVEPVILRMFLRKPRSEQLRVDPDHAPGADGLGETVSPKYALPARQPRRIDDLVRVLPGWLIADIVVAGQRAPGRRERRERAPGKRHLIVALGAVDAQIAVHHDEIG